MRLYAWNNPTGAPNFSGSWLVVAAPNLKEARRLAQFAPIMSSGICDSGVLHNSAETRKVLEGPPDFVGPAPGGVVYSWSE